jgi:hypothetical protein
MGFTLHIYNSCLAQGPYLMPRNVMSCLACLLALHAAGEAFRATAGLALGYMTRPFFKVEQVLYPVYNALLRIFLPNAEYEVRLSDAACVFSSLCWFYSSCTHSPLLPAVALRTGRGGGGVCLQARATSWECQMASLLDKSSLHALLRCTCLLLYHS